ncbi:hypothetical protein ACU5P1_12860 [Pseudomonas plecoglossicida]|uniref:Lipoprotein n=1 Tax=Pseudomonas plecoglossicida TaxID=70775 RepID=A0AAD0QSS2_PSEDL|nr:hypothetical protein [Pseudomonas plecoglossicida]AXM94883.1 hypothetical protein DVB73_03185 [Pseudomonas plecoglossicida]EPB94020.1 hypothetical protein L321_19382 [Pseudomonas plecoglossicida NB2011]QLB55624.1 hypothetical protein HAV28_12730 [Pseudomonas plecoglossicida]GLR36183.1 hypothetical protein GCM10011247_15800 [Pseudomonas plecoglossicida]
MHRKIVPLALFASLVGCSETQDVSKASFQKAAQSYLDTQYPHCFVVTDFPTRTQDFDVTGNNKALHALAGVGIVREKEIARVEVPKRLWQEARTDIYYAYDLTEEGRKYYKADAQKLSDGQTHGGLCFGKAEVTAVEQFSEPAKRMGQTVSDVTFAYTITGLPDWASNAEVKATIGELDKALATRDTPAREKQVMVLTQHGWVHEGLVARR